MTDDHPPRLVYDDRCGFCTWATEFAIRRADFEPVGFGDLTLLPLEFLLNRLKCLFFLYKPDASFFKVCFHLGMLGAQRRILPGACLFNPQGGTKFRANREPGRCRRRPHPR